MTFGSFSARDWMSCLILSCVFWPNAPINCSLKSRCLLILLHCHLLRPINFCSKNLLIFVMTVILRKWIQSQRRFFGSFHETGRVFILTFSKVFGFSKSNWSFFYAVKCKSGNTSMHWVNDRGKSNYILPLTINSNNPYALYVTQQITLLWQNIS